jgi:beta-glucosidase
VVDLLQRMTLEEKVGQMLQLDARGDVNDLVSNKLVGSLLHTSPKRIVEARKLVLSTRLQIPLLMADDCIQVTRSGPEPLFFHAAGHGKHLGPGFGGKGARATAVEVPSTGRHWTFSPVLCISTDLRRARVNDTFGEDPHLIGALGKAMIRGYQG